MTITHGLGDAVQTVLQTVLLEVERYHCQQHLAGFKAPKAVVFAEALPKNPSGKLLKRELRQRHQGHFGSAA